MIVDTVYYTIILSLFLFFLSLTCFHLEPYCSSAKHIISNIVLIIVDVSCLAICRLLKTALMMMKRYKIPIGFQGDCLPYFEMMMSCFVWGAFNTRWRLLSPCCREKVRKKRRRKRKRELTGRTTVHRQGTDTLFSHYKTEAKWSLKMDRPQRDSNSRRNILFY